MRRAALLLVAACRFNFDAIGGGSGTGDAPDGDARLGTTDQGLATGDQFTCSMRLDRSVWCWGDGRYGQLATGQLELATAPKASLITGAKVIDGGERHACALLLDGRMLCWGHNGYGQLADMDATPKPTPFEITGLPAAIEQIAVGFNHTCA